MKKVELPRFVKYPKIPYLEEDADILSQEVYVFEKLDGALVQIRKHQGNLLAGSKSNFLFGERSRNSWFPEFLKWVRTNKTLNNLPENLVIFGEWLVPTTIDYDLASINRFYFVDLAHIAEDQPGFYDYEEARTYLDDKWAIEGMRILPPITRGLFSEGMINDIKETRRSRLREGKMEGVVLKNYQTQQFAKALNSEYSEIREQEKSLEKKYVNKVRVRKAIRRLREESSIPNPTIDQLVDEVVDDIEAESGKDVNRPAVKAIIRIKRMYSR